MKIIKTGLIFYRIIYKENANSSNDKKGHSDKQDPLMNMKKIHICSNHAGPLIGDRLWRIIAAILDDGTAEENSRSRK